jgi:hypothetical protein
MAGSRFRYVVSLAILFVTVIDWFGVNSIMIKAKKKSIRAA